jgi:hypothetical protein
LLSVTKKIDEMSTDNAKGAHTIPVPVQMSHHIDLGESGSHLVHSLKNHTVQGKKDTFFHVQSAAPSLLFTICKLE